MYLTPAERRFTGSEIDAYSGRCCTVATNSGRGKHSAGRFRFRKSRVTPALPGLAMPRAGQATSEGLGSSIAIEIRTASDPSARFTRLPRVHRSATAYCPASNWHRIHPDGGSAWPDDLDIGRMSPTGRSAKSPATALLTIGSSGRCRHHSATAKQYCSSSSVVARHPASR